MSACGPPLSATCGPVAARAARVAAWRCRRRATRRPGVDVRRRCYHARMPGNGAAGASYGDLLVTSLLVLGAVCIAAFIAVRVFGRLIATGRARGAHLLDVVARVPLEPRRSLYVVEVAGKTLLVGTSEMGLSVLTELDAAEVQARKVVQPSFADLVRNAWKRRRRVVPDDAIGSAEKGTDDKDSGTTSGTDTSDKGGRDAP